MRRVLFRTPCTLGVSPTGAISCAYRFTSTSGELPPRMKTAFTPAQYRKLCQAMPEWEEDFRGMPKLKICQALEDLGFTSSTATSMASKVIDHIDDVEQQRILQSIKIPRVTAGRSPSSFYARADSLEVATKYITDVVTTRKNGYNATDPDTGKRGSKVAVLGPSGVKGIGKTEFLLHLAHHRLVKIGKKLKKKLVPVYVSFSGDGMDNAALFTEYLSHHAGGASPTRRHYLRDAFAHVLLKSCGAVVGTTHAISLSEALACLREASRLSEDDVVVLLVDEIGELEDSWAVDTINAVMSCVDEERGKLAVLFSHIDQEVLNTAARMSGRRVLPLPLPPLPLHSWERLPMAKGKPMKFWAKTNSGLHQLLLSLSGHPRSIFDGFPAALKANPLLLTSESPEEFSVARHHIIIESKLNDTTDRYLGELVPEWLANRKVDKHQLIRDGLLHQLQSDSSVQFLFPLKVLEWAKNNFEGIAVAYHICQMFHWDQILGHHAEKRMKDVLLHYEAAKRAACGTQCETLGKYYGDVKCMNPDLKDTRVRCNPPAIAYSHVFHAKSFDDADMAKVVNRLRHGYIAVSGGGSEVGIEYLVPFFDDTTGAMLVACMQCKCVQKAVKWNEAHRRMNTAIARFMKLPNTTDVTFFPVVYSTADRDTVPKSESRATTGIYRTSLRRSCFASRLAWVCFDSMS